VPRGGDRFWPSDNRVEELRARGEAIADRVAAAGYDVIGDAEDLRPPSFVPERRHPDSVTDDELVSAAADVIAATMSDVRRLTRQNRALQHRPPPAPPPRRIPEWVRRPVRPVLRRVRSLWPGSQRDDG
jgi:hypothetical protein